MPLLTGNVDSWPDRTIFIQGYPTVDPQIRRCFMARNQKYKLVQPYGHPTWHKTIDNRISEENFTYELYDIAKDPGELNNIADKHPEIVANMKKQYEDWFTDVTTNPGVTRPRPVAVVGSEHENPVMIECWENSNVNIVKEGYYRITVKPSGKIRWTFNDTIGMVWAGDKFIASNDSKCNFNLADIELSMPIESGAIQCVFEKVYLPAGVNNFYVEVSSDGQSVINRLDETDNLPFGPVHLTFEQINK